MKLIFWRKLENFLFFGKRYIEEEQNSIGLNGKQTWMLKLKFLMSLNKGSGTMGAAGAFTTISICQKVQKTWKFASAYKTENSSVPSFSFEIVLYWSCGTLGATLVKLKSKLLEI